MLFLNAFCPSQPRTAPHLGRAFSGPSQAVRSCKSELAEWIKDTGGSFPLLLDILRESREGTTQADNRKLAAELVWVVAPLD